MEECANRRGNGPGMRPWGDYGNIRLSRFAGYPHGVYPAVSLPPVVKRIFPYRLHSVDACRAGTPPDNFPADPIGQAFSVWFTHYTVAATPIMCACGVQSASRDNRRGIP